jgi:pyruvate,orthophosphate dikinase
MSDSSATTDIVGGSGKEGTTKWVYKFSEGSKDMKDLLGGKGANLAEMTRLGLPVPPGFTITTQACVAYLRSGRFPPGMLDQVEEALRWLEEAVGRRLGDPDDPLLVSVRSGAKFSMPGMMDTVLNLGLNRRSLEGLASKTSDRRFALDSYRRFIQMFGKIVRDIPGERFEQALDDAKKAAGVQSDADLGESDLERLVEVFEGIYEEATGESFPQDPREQLEAAIEAVFESWNNERARVYRRKERIPDDLGTAVNVQAMVFGNKGANSGTGVAFTRDPATGERGAYGDFLPNAQGEDVVAGIRNTLPLHELESLHPEPYKQLLEIMARLEQHYRDMCDIEFTIEEGKLYMLQTRVGKRTAKAALRIAVDMVEEGLIDEAEAVCRIEPEALDQLLHPQFDRSASFEVVARGVAASPGAAVGSVVFTSEDAVAAAAEGRSVILVRRMTDPDDLPGMIAAVGVLTAAGGKTSHAAVVSRGMGKPCVVGCEALKIDETERIAYIDGTAIREGDVISIDGATGEVVIGEVPLVRPEITGELGTILGWADAHRRLGVRANADTPADARLARSFGAEGIGLCRTEHMFLGDRLPIVQRFILAESEAEEEAALADLLEVQRKDFEEIFEAMDGLPVTIRLLDPPLHEFLPHRRELEAEIAVLEQEGRKASPEYGEKKRFLAALERWEEANPMLGVRGCRLGLLKPGLYGMQVRAIVEAAAARLRAGGNPKVEIMVPLVADVAELERLAEEIRRAAAEASAAAGEAVEYEIGTMIEVPRAALSASLIGEKAAFFSFGTNDLTQTTWAFSRDDVEAKLIPHYLSEGILKDNPFETLDRTGVGRLVEIGTSEGRAANPALKVGVCGEHGGDPRSIAFFDKVGVDYVSASPYRVPVARLAAAQAALGRSGDETR